MKTILVATDFSPAALNAANYAADMALAINADLMLLHVFHLPINYYDAPVMASESELVEDCVQNIVLLKNALIRKTAGKIKIDTTIKNDAFFDGLNAVCNETSPYVVIMGSQGTTATERFFFGGHTVNAMQHLAWPLICVPIGASFSAIKRIGFACDFNGIVGTAPIDEIIALVKDFNAELHVLNIGREDAYNAELVFEAAQLKEMLLPLKPIYYLVTSNHTDKEIMNFAETKNIDLLVVLPKRHGLLDKLLAKSHTKQLVLHCHVPVAALHAIDY